MEEKKLAGHKPSYITVAKAGKGNSYSFAHYREGEIVSFSTMSKASDYTLPDFGIFAEIAVQVDKDRTLFEKMENHFVSVLDKDIQLDHWEEEAEALKKLEGPKENKLLQFIGSAKGKLKSKDKQIADLKAQVSQLRDRIYSPQPQNRMSSSTPSSGSSGAGDLKRKPTAPSSPPPPSTTLYNSSFLANPVAVQPTPPLSPPPDDSSTVRAFPPPVPTPPAFPHPDDLLPRKVSSAAATPGVGTFSSSDSSMTSSLTPTDTDADTPGSENSLKMIG